MSIEIRQHTPGKDLSDFLRVPYEILGEDPNWVPALDLMMRDMLTPAKNPFFQHADVALFTARRDGKLAGRISAEVDREHLKRYQDATGYFGFFDTIDDDRVGQALVAAAKNWLANKGIKRMRGPLSLSINEEVGTLVDGFDSPNVLFMGHHLPYQDRVASAAGLEKAKDLFAFRWEMGSLPKRAQRAHDQIMSYPEVRIREAEFGKEIRELIAIQDDAWRHNWGHVSMTEAEAAQFASDLALLLDKRIALVAEINGELAAICLAVPNLNEVIRDFRGKLLPLGLPKLIWRLKIKRPKSGRLVLLGIKEEYRKQKRYGFLAMALVAEIAERGRKAGYEWGELSWTLEDNTPVNLLIKACGGKHYKTYRVYEADVTNGVGPLQ